MSNFQYVTLVAVNGTPVRLADQHGAPFPTTGTGALVFANGPTLTNATFVGNVPSPLTTRGDLYYYGASGTTRLPLGTSTYVLTSNGTDAVWSPAAGGSGTYPPTPVPDFQTYCQAAFDTGQSVNWIWGNIVLNAPVRVHMNANSSGFAVNLNGAVVYPSASYPVNTAVDMVTFIIDNGHPNTNIQNFRLQSGVFLGINPSAAFVCRNAVAIACQLNESGIYNGGVSECQFVAASRSGLQLYGSVFEFDIVSCGFRDNGYSGCELRNPNVGGAGIISSINFYGGDARTNGTGGAGKGYGIASTAETTFQEAHGFFIYSTNFIANGSAGLLCPAGVDLVIGSHFENNCSNNGGEVNAGVWIGGGGTGIFYESNAAHSTGNNQTYFLRTAGGASLFQHCYSANESTGSQELTAVGTGTGTWFVDSTSTSANFSGGGGYTVKVNNTTNTVV
jgi:hypothetical protein